MAKLEQRRYKNRRIKAQENLPILLGFYPSVLYG